MENSSLMLRALCSAFLCILFAGCQTKYVADTDETFVVIAARSPSDVAMTAPPIGGTPSVSVGVKLQTGERLTWVDGSTYPKWKSTSMRALPLGIGDPIFEDVYFQMKDRSAMEALRYSAGKEVVGTVYKVDSQLRLIAAPAGSPIYVLEKPLTQEDAKAFEAVLKDMKFDPGPVDGIIDAKTRAAMGLYLEYRGHEYRPLNPAISTALFAELVGRLPE